jgi:5-methylthioadenosine/S-adenosylhomocysteine deaminase
MTDRADHDAAIWAIMIAGMRNHGEETNMCVLCGKDKPQNRFASRRDFLKGTAAVGVAATALGLFTPQAAATDDGPLQDSGRPGRRYVIRNGYVMTMDPSLPGGGDYIRGDVLVVGTKIEAVGPNLDVGDAAEIDARGRVVMPGFIDTHHHQAWTAIRSSIPDSILIDDGTDTPSAQQNYFANVLAGPTGTSGFARHYRPEDVYISELFGGLAQLDNGVTAVHDISQIHHSPDHSNEAIRALRDTGRRAKLGYFESAGNVPGNQYPTDAIRIRTEVLTSDDALVTMTMGGEVYLGPETYTQSWQIGRQLGPQIAAHILSAFARSWTIWPAVVTQTHFRSEATTCSST